MFGSLYRNPHELAWLQEHATLARHVCLLGAVLFGMYGLVDAAVMPGAFQRTWYLRAVGCLLCVFALVPLRAPTIRPWATAYLALAASTVITLVNLIFLGILRSPDLALAAQMQCLMLVGVIAILRSFMVTTFVVILVGFNAGLVFCAVPWSTVALHNAFLVFGMLVLWLVGRTQARQYFQLRAIRSELQAKDIRFRMAIETSPEGFCIVDAHGVVQDVNQAYCNLSGYRREALLGMNAQQLEVFDAPHNAQALAQRLQAIRVAGTGTCEMRHRRADGSVWSVEAITTYSGRDDDLFFVFIKDLTERKQAEARMHRQAHFDALTDLPNRTLLFDRLEQACLMAKRDRSEVALLFADLDGFKAVNDRYGHAAGDAVLQSVAQRWQTLVRTTDTIARLGGDEFAVLLGGDQTIQAAMVLAAKLITTLQPPISLPEGQRVQIGVSIGIALFPMHAQSTDALISEADAAMYTSKRRGKNTYTVADANPSPVVHA